MTQQVAVVFGGPSPEHDVSVLTGLQAGSALSAAGRAPRALYWSRVGDWFEVDARLEAEAFVRGVPDGARPLQLASGAEGGFFSVGALGRHKRVEVGVVINCCHGGPGEDGSLQGALDLARVDHAGPTALGAALGMDKLAFGAAVASAGLPTLPRALVTPAGERPSFAGPYIVKPRFGGSSIGIEVVADYATAQSLAKSSVHLRQGAVVEPHHAEASDIQLSVRSWPDLQLSPIERPLRSQAGAEILGYADKYVGGEGMVSAPRELPAALPADVEADVRSAAVVVAGLVGLRGVARIDFLYDGADLFVNEVNTIPGSLSKYLWEAALPPLTFLELLDDLVSEALARPARHHTAAGADGTALRSAGSIASKLG